MYCIDNPHTDAYFNLAAEEYLLKNFPGDVFMLWQNEPSVIIGKHQNIQTEVNLDFIRGKQIKVARRYSGGGAVYHDPGNLNLTFIETSNHPDFDKYVRQMQDFLSTVGIHATSDERRALYINGLKISGSAQYIRRNKVLYHATLLFSSNLANLTATLYNRSAEMESVQPSEAWRYVKSVKSAVTNISEHLPQSLSIHEFRKEIIKYFIINNINSYTYTFNTEDTAAITKLEEEKYATTEWNFHAKVLK